MTRSVRLACAREARAAPAQHQRTESSFSSGRDSCARGLRLYRAASRAVFSYHHRMNLHGENLSHLRKRERISFRCTALNALYKDAPLGVCSFRSFPVGSYYVHALYCMRKRNFRSRTRQSSLSAFKSHFHTESSQGGQGHRHPPLSRV